MKGKYQPVGVGIYWELRNTLGPKLWLYMGLIKEEEFTFFLQAAETSCSKAMGVLCGREHAPHPDIKKHPDAED